MLRSNLKKIRSKHGNVWEKALKDKKKSRLSRTNTNSVDMWTEGFFSCWWSSWQVKYKLSRYESRNLFSADGPADQRNTSSADMPRKTTHEARSKPKSESNELQNSQNLSHTFTTSWWVFTQKIKTSPWISWILEEVREKMRNSWTTSTPMMWNPTKHDPNPNIFEL